MASVGQSQSFDPGDCPRGPLVRIPITSLTQSPEPGMILMTDSCRNQYYTFPDSLPVGGVINQYFNGDTLITILNNGDTLISIGNSITDLTYSGDTLCIYTSQGDTFCTVITITADTSGTGRFRLMDNLGVSDTLWTYSSPATPDLLNISNAVRLDLPNTLKWGGDLVDPTTTVHSPDSTHNITYQDVKIMRHYGESMRFYPWQQFLIDPPPGAWVDLRSKGLFTIRADQTLHLDLSAGSPVPDTTYLRLRTNRLKKSIAKNGSVLQLLQVGSGANQGTSDWTPYALPLTAPADTGNYMLNYNGSNFTFQPGSGGTVGGSGTLNYLAKFTPNGTTIGNSQVFDNGTDVGVNSTAKIYFGSTAASINKQAFSNYIESSGGFGMAVGSSTGVAMMLSRFSVGPNAPYAFSVGNAVSTPDGSLSRLSPNVIGVGTGLAGSSDGTLIAKRIGINTLSTIRALTVDSTARITGSVDTAAVALFWVGNAQGDLRKVNKGSDITIQGDSIKINVPALPAGTVLNSTLRWSGTAWLENDSLLVNADGESAYGGAAINTARSIVTPKAIRVQNLYIGDNDVNTNTLIGNNVSATTGSFNTAIGEGALNANTFGIYHTAIGRGAMRHGIGGVGTTVVGASAATWKGSIDGGTIMGFGAMGSTGSSTGANNTAMGRETLYSITSSGSNTGIGAYVFRSLTGGGTTFNTGIGFEAGRNSLGIQGSTFLGNGSGYNSDASHSVFLGRNAGFSVDKDSTLFVDVTSDTTGTLVGNFRTKRIGINRNPWGIARTLDVGGTLRVRDNVDTTTVTQFWAGNLIGDLKRMYIGDGLGVVGDTIKVSYVEQPPSPYILAENNSIVPYIDTISNNNSKNIRFPLIGASKDWVLTGNTLEYQGLDTFMSKIHVEVDLSASAGTTIELRLRANIFGGSGMEVIARRRLSIGASITNVSLDYLYGVPYQCIGGGSADLYDVEITNVSGTQKIFTIYAATITNIKVGDYEIICPE